MHRDRSKGQQSFMNEKNMLIGALIGYGVRMRANVPCFRDLDKSLYSQINCMDDARAHRTHLNGLLSKYIIYAVSFIANVKK